MIRTALAAAAGLVLVGLLVTTTSLAIVLRADAAAKPALVSCGIEPHVVASR